MNKQTEKAISILKYYTPIGAINAGSKEEPSEDVKAFNMGISALEQQLNNGWIPVTERLPNMEECQKNDCRFIVTDGNRVYEDSFDYMADGYIEPHWTYSTMCQPTAWRPLPEPWKGEEE